MNGIVRTDGLLALVPAADHSEKVGYFVEFSSGTASVVNATTDKPIGVIVDGETTSGSDTIALSNFPGVVKVKLSGAVTQGDFLTVANDGTVITDAGTGSRIQVARALETGVSGDLVNAILQTPLALS
jgi:hypothetical protein